MARWTDLAVTLTANQAAAIDPILPALNSPGGGTNRTIMRACNRAATAVELLLTAGGPVGSGVAVAAAASIPMADAPFDGALYARGNLGDVIVLWYC